eukprot:6458572-Amphidinium_carterae.1
MSFCPSPVTWRRVVVTDMLFAAPTESQHAPHSHAAPVDDAQTFAIDNIPEHVEPQVPCEHDSASDKEETLSTASDDDQDGVVLQKSPVADAHLDDAHTEPSEEEDAAPVMLSSHTSARGSKRKREEHDVSAHVEVPGLVHEFPTTTDP